MGSLLALSTAEWAQLVAAVAAAVAAIGSLATALLLWLQSRSALRPNVSAGINNKGEGTALSATFANAGPGLAIQLTFCLEGNPPRLVGDGHMQAGAQLPVDLKASSVGLGTSRMIWLCRDVTQALHIWTYDNRHIRLSQRKWEKMRPSPVALFNTMYPAIREPT